MPLIIPANSITGGFAVDNSLRFNDGSSDSLNKTGSSGNRKTWTWSCWIKRSTVGSGSSHLIFGASSDGFSTDYFDISFTSADKINIQDYQGSEALRYIPTRVFRDVSAWYHIVIRVDTTQGTASNRLRIYINGVEETAFDTETDPSQNTDLLVNNNVVHRIGGRDGDYSNLYLAECVLIDGSSLAPTSFGEFDEDTGIWKPIDVSGLTFGTNGFYLDFEDSSNLGNDANGGTDFTVNNLTAIDQTTDTPTNNYATMNPLDNYYELATFSEGNLKIVGSGSNYSAKTCTFGVNKGKWYYEAKCTAVSSAPIEAMLGLIETNATSNTFFTGTPANSVGFYKGGSYYKNGGSTAYGSMWGASDILSIAFDLDNDKIYIAINGTWQNSADPVAGSGGISLGTPSSGFYYPSTTEGTFEMNFGNPPFTISSGNSDGAGFGQFEYAPPSGYLSLCTKNLATDG
jgi:hypothetical protein